MTRCRAFWRVLVHRILQEQNSRYSQTQVLGPGPSSVVTPWGSCRLQKNPRKPGKSRKKYPQNYKSPTPGWAPKVRKKNTPKNTTIARTLAFCTFFFRISRGQSRVGDLIIVSYLCRISGLGWFLYSVRAPRDYNTSIDTRPGKPNQQLGKNCLR